jgi:hypothetical protein
MSQMEVGMSGKVLKNLAFLLVFAVLAALLWHTLSLPHDAVAKIKDTAHPTFQGGNGDTPGTAVVISGAPDYVSVVAAEFQFLKQKFGQRGRDWRLVKKEEYQHDGQVYDLITIEFPNEIRRMVFFNITAYFKKT